VLDWNKRASLPNLFDFIQQPPHSDWIIPFTKPVLVTVSFWKLRGSAGHSDWWSISQLPYSLFKQTVKYQAGPAWHYAFTTILCLAIISVAPSISIFIPYRYLQVAVSGAGKVLLCSSLWCHQLHTFCKDGCHFREAWCFQPWSRCCQ